MLRGSRKDVLGEFWKAGGNSRGLRLGHPRGREGVLGGRGWKKGVGEGLWAGHPARQKR